MSERIAVCQTGELQPGDQQIVETERGISIGVFNVDGEYHALLNTCLHQNGPVCEGNVEAKIVGEHPGIGKRVREKFSDEQVIKCPWHGWEYEIETGRLLDDESMSLPTFDVVTEDGTIFVDL